MMEIPSQIKQDWVTNTLKSAEAKDTYANKNTILRIKESNKTPFPSLGGWGAKQIFSFLRMT